MDVLDRVQRSLSVEMIMTPRVALMTCVQNETAAAVKAKNVDDYSFLPLIDEQGRFVGLYDAARWFQADAPEEEIGDDFERFSEDLVIGADASIFEFVRVADQRPTRLVVSGPQIAGLVSLSDLQKLPVRAALFTLITALEMVMAIRIKAEWPRDDDAWLCKVSADRRDAILERAAEARRSDHFVDLVNFSQLSDKATVLCKQRMVGGSLSLLRKDFNRIRDLRDNLAHANVYAETPAAAKAVCATIRRIFDIKVELLKAIEERRTLAAGSDAVADRE